MDALTFYQREEEALARAVEDEKTRIKTRSIGIAFVTFGSIAEAKQVFKDHR